VKLARARVVPVELPLRAPLLTARGALHARASAVVALESEDGAVGFGEATPPWGDATPGSLADEVARLCTALLGVGLAPLRAALARLDAIVAAPAARFAVETALFDLVARTRRGSLAAVLANGGAIRESVAVNALLRETAPEAAAAEALRARAQGFRTVKLKVGADGAARDRERLEAVRAALGASVQIRADANGAWPVELAISVLRELEPVELELVEQPVAARDVAGLARVRSAVLVPIAADESAAAPESVARVLALGAADALALKPAAIGGLRASLALAERARAAGVRVYVTSGLDGALARAAALALAAALPDPLPACGLATGALLAEDLGRGPEPKDGALEIPACPGLGVAVDPAALAALARGAVREVARP
jgi:o-succinylbenzoate synthase